MPDEPPRRPRGRPRIDPDDPAITVTVRLPSKQFDAYCKSAQRLSVSVPEVIRRTLKAGRRRDELE